MRWLSAIAIVAIALQYVFLALEVLAPFLEGDFSVDAWRLVGSDTSFILGFFALGVFYDRTKTSELSDTHRFFVNSLLCIGGLAYFASYLLLRQQLYVWALTVLSVSLLMLALGRSLTSAA